MIEELYKKYYEELINWCHSMTGNLYTAEELVHEAFLRAMLHEDTLSTLKEQQSRSWLYRTVKNLYVDRLRHGKKEIISDEFSQLQIDSEELVRLEWEKLLETLPDLEGVIFSLRYLEGYNSKQIGDKRGRTADYGRCHGDSGGSDGDRRRRRRMGNCASGSLYAGKKRKNTGSVSGCPAIIRSYVPADSTSFPDLHF